MAKTLVPSTVRRLMAVAALGVLGGAALPSTALAQYGAPPPYYRQAPSPNPRLELTGIAGYQINTDISVHNAYGQHATLSVGDAPVYGASIGVETVPGLRTEAIWFFSEPEVRGYGGMLSGSSAFNVPTHYFQIGGTQSVRRDALEVFGGGTLGAVLFMPGTVHLSTGSTVSLGDTWNFAFTLAGGLKIHLSRNLALRGEVRLAAPVYFTSGAVYVGGGGAGMTVSGGIPLWQWNFLGGLVFSP